MIKMIHSIRTELGSKTTKKIFMVNRKRVLKALYWLKEYNQHYKNITIKKTNLDWIPDDVEEKEIPNIEEIEANETETDNDIGPAPSQLKNSELCNISDDYTSFGMIPETGNNIPTKESLVIDKNLKEQSRKCPKVMWPSIGKLAVSEFDSDLHIFALAFPWLFPGGVGDYNDYHERKVTLQEWIERLVRYYDARFQTDKMFCFYVLNYLNRHRNQSSGSFFVRKFCNYSEDITLDDIKQEVNKGNHKFLNSIIYLSKQIKGSNSFWRSKRDELSSWVSHHVEMGNGAPNYFGTLSCAEYWWPDIRRLIQQKIEIATGKCLDLSNDHVNIIQLMNDHTATIQEFFQYKIEKWMLTIGEQILGIKHYWLRYEFAPSRGQIHAHFLAICEDQQYQFRIHENRHNPNAVAKIVEEWSEKKLD